MILRTRDKNLTIYIQFQVDRLLGTKVSNPLLFVKINLNTKPVAVCKVEGRN